MTSFKRKARVATRSQETKALLLSIRETARQLSPLWSSKWNVNCMNLWSFLTIILWHTSIVLNLLIQMVSVALRFERNTPLIFWLFIFTFAFHVNPAATATAWLLQNVESIWQKMCHWHIKNGFAVKIFDLDRLNCWLSRSRGLARGHTRNYRLRQQRALRVVNNKMRPLGIHNST